MINFTNEENKIFKKVKIAYHQQDLCRLIKEQIEQIQTDLQDSPYDIEFKEKLNLLQNLLREIQSITKYKDMQVYEEKTNCAYWDAKMLNNVIDEIIEEEKQAKN